MLTTRKIKTYRKIFRSKWFNVLAKVWNRWEVISILASIIRMNVFATCNHHAKNASFISNNQENEWGQWFLPNC